MDAPTLIASIISILGAICVLYKLWYGYLIWVISNIIFIYISFYTGLYETLGMWIVNLVTASVGSVKWYKESRSDKSRCDKVLRSNKRLYTSVLFSIQRGIRRKKG